MNKNIMAIIVALISAAFTLPVVAIEQITGAYVRANTQDQAVVDAANFAATEIGKGKLVTIISAKSQVVAGINYKLILEIAQDDGSHHRFKAIVFVPLPVTNLPMQLTSYEDIGVL